MGGTLGANGADVLSPVEDGEAVALHDVLDLDELHAEPEVWFVGPVIFHGVLPRHSEERLIEVNALDLAEKRLHEPLEDVENVLLLDKAHLAVNLSELWLTVGSQILVAEALDNLEVAVETGHHKELLACLRALR